MTSCVPSRTVVEDRRLVLWQSHLTSANVPEVQHRVKEPKLRHGKRCTRYNTQGWAVLPDNSASASAADLVTGLDSDEYNMIQSIQTNDMQYTPASPCVFYTKCPWCHQFPADHHREDCPRKFGRVPKKLSHLNPCSYCKVYRPDHYGRHCHMKPVFKEHNQDRIWKYNKCYYCQDDPPDHPGRKCPLFGKYWKDQEMMRARSRSPAVSSLAITSSILQDGYVDAAIPVPTPPAIPSNVAPSSSSSSSSSPDLPSVLHAGSGNVHVPIGEIRIFPCAQKSCNRLAAQGFVDCCKYCSSSSGVNHSGRCQPRENFVTFALGHKR